MDTQQIPPNHGHIQERYVAKINALVAANREHLIADITAECALHIDGNAGTGELKAA